MAVDRWRDAVLWKLCNRPGANGEQWTCERGENKTVYHRRLHRIHLLYHTRAVFVSLNKKLYAFRSHLLGMQNDHGLARHLKRLHGAPKLARDIDV